MSPITKSDGNVVDSSSLTTLTRSSSKSFVPEAPVRDKSKSAVVRSSLKPNVKSKKAMVSKKRMAPSEGEEKAPSKRPNVCNDRRKYQEAKSNINLPEPLLYKVYCLLFLDFHI